METGWLFWALLLVPVLAAGLCLILPSARAVMAALCVTVVAAAALAGLTAWRVLAGGPLHAAGDWLFLDALSAWHLIILQIVFVLSSFFARTYFAAEAHGLELYLARRFGALWLGSLAAMTLVLLSNNLGIMWVGIEATTLLTAFLICIHTTPASLEAIWKYLIMCSVGVAFSFIGTLLVGASAGKVNLDASQMLLWTQLKPVAASLDPALIKMAFIFLLIGYGTKTGFAPMHAWLPDAHSQAPAPVSAVFSGFLLNAALYCIMRYVPLVEAATGNTGWGTGILVFFGLLSILVAGAFIVFQHDAKRLLAYHSVEHMGIIALGVGLGGLGVFGAMFHVLNHSVCKAVSFFSAGRLGQIYGGHDLRKMSGAMRASPLWGGGFFVSLLALIGVAPFAVFMSEFQIVKAAVDGRSYWSLGVFLAGTGIVFVGALRHAISMAWDDPVPHPATVRTGVMQGAVIVIPLTALLVLGLWMPNFLREAMAQAANVIADCGL
jgi:hydrogenase-4 component F